MAKKSTKYKTILDFPVELSTKQKTLNDNFIILDFETYSDIDIDFGAEAYSLGQDAFTVCLALIYKNEKYVFPGSKPLPKKWADRINSGKYVFVAHNVLFEYFIYNNVFRKEQSILGVDLAPLEIDQFHDTMASFLYYGYGDKRGASLDTVSVKLGLDQIKFAQGRRAMLEITRLGKFTPDYKKKLQLTMEYCLGDTEIEQKAFLKLGLIPNMREREIFLYTLKMNVKGIPVDRPRLEIFREAYFWFRSNVDAVVDKLSGGALTKDDLTKRNIFFTYLQTHGLNPPNLQKGTLDKIVDDESIDVNVRRLIRLRVELTKSSVTKLDKMYGSGVPRKGKKGKLAVTYYTASGSLRYYGAHTGRFSGQGIQPQNFVRDTFSDADMVKFLKLCDAVRITNGNRNRKPTFKHLHILEDMPKVLRKMIVPTPGNKLVMIDYAQIEARVLAWVTGTKALVKSFVNGTDVYMDFAKKLYNDPGLTKAKDPEKRQIGKNSILGLGYGMGAPRFKDQVLTQGGVEISDAFAQKAVTTYRTTYPLVPSFWNVCNKIFNLTIMTKDPGRPFNVPVAGGESHIVFKWNTFIDGVELILPSGRSLYYPESEVGVDGEIKYMKMNKLYGGKITENIIQAIARDIMVEAMMLSDEAIFTVHDEIVFDVPKTKNVRIYEKRMKTEGCPAWFPQDLIAVDTSFGACYGK